MSTAQTSISSIAPATGTVGATVTITGSDFNTTAANNIVYFGAVRAATPSAASATSLTVTVPLGAAYGPVTVLNTATGLQAQSKVYFNPVHTDTKANIVEADFAKTTVSSGTPGSWSMPCERADLDLDGDIDLIMNNYNSTPAGLLVFPNVSSLGNIAIASSIGYPVIAPVRGLVTADIDGDGKQDIIGVGDYSSVSVWRNTSTSSISFAPRVDISMANSGNDIAVGDLDGDGKLDLAVTNNWASRISVFRNTSTSGSISFAANVEFTAPSSVWGVKIGDINGDGKNDIVTTNVNGAACFSIFRNTGTTTGTLSFATRSDFTNGTIGGKWIELGDIDMDGKLDLVVSNNDWIVSVFRNTSAGNTLSFATPVSSNYGWVVDRINIGDLNGDTKPDIIIPRGGMVAILTNNSTSGNIVLSGQFDMGAPSGGGMASIEVVDLDRDGKLDLFNGSDNGKIDFYRYSPPPPPPPSITSFTPATGAAGTTVTITGISFSTTLANNLVFFGATKATVTAATATSLTVTVPAGATADPITYVNAANGLIAVSNSRFIPTFTPVKATLSNLDFSTRSNFDAATYPYTLVISDIDGDGKSDIAVSNYLSGSVSILRNTATTTGAVSFAAPVNFSTHNNPYDIAVGDLNGDGKPDIVSANGGFAAHNVSLLRNTSTPGTISFAAKVDIGMGPNPFGVAIGDVDRDGKLDIISANAGDGSVTVRLNTTTNPATLSFNTTQTYTGVSASKVVIADFDGDGKNDFAVNGNNIVGVFRNTSNATGTISFAAKQDFTVGSQPERIAVADVDADGKLDLVVANYASNTLSILKNNSTTGTISFLARQDITTGNGPNSIAFGDFTGDGAVDVVSCNRSGSYSVFRNTSSGGSISFAARVDVAAAVNSSPYSVGAGDFDGDGLPDIAISNSAFNTANAISVYRSMYPPPPAPIVTSFSPLSGPVGTTVTITGLNFNATAANNVVFFGATKATVTAGSTTSLTVTVPAGATYSNITVVNMGLSLSGSSNQNFTPTYTPNKSTIGVNDFDPKIEIATGTGTSWPYQVQLGDIDGDGKADVVVANRAGNNVSVFRNTSTSGTVTFATRLDFSTAQEPRGLVLSDLDGDGKLDIATTGGNLNQVAMTILRNTSTSGNISFATKQEINTSVATYSIAAADIDGDGREELVFGTSKMIIYPNTSALGSISFGTPIDYTASGNINSIAIGDIDGDGKKDICYTGSGNVSVFRNTSTIGNISLATKVDFAAPQAYGITIGDWDSDGKADIAASLLNVNNALSILRNTSTTGAISFAARNDYNAPQNPYFVAAGDLNGDGKADFVTTNAGQNGTAANLSIFRNQSISAAISIAGNVNLALGSWPYYAAIGDLDGDGRPDIVSSSVEANKIAIFRNNPQFQTVTVSGTLNAFAGCAGTASASQSFTAGGTGLTANLVITAPAGYEVSTSSGGGYVASITLTPNSGTVASTTIYVRLAATATGTPSGNITVASTGATTQNVAVTGAVTTINNQTVTASPSSFCGSGTSTITVASTQAGVSYTLRNNANNAIVAGPVMGTGSAITFSTGNITSTTTYNVYAQTSTSGALQFDGVDDYIAVPNDNAFNTNTYTVEGWIYPTGGADYKWIFGKRTPSNGWNLYINPSNNLELWNGFNAMATGPVIPFNTWSHVAITGSTSGQKIYLNGLQVAATGGVAAPCDPSAPFTIGTNSDALGPWFFGGSMDEVRVWSVERTATQLLNNMNTAFVGNEAGLLALYTFSDGTGSSTLTDLAGGNNNGTLTNMNVNTAWVAGRTSSSGPACNLQLATTPTVTVTQAPTPTITAGGPTSFCTGGSVTLTASAGTSYLWSNGATTQAITVSTGGSYTVQVTYSAGCFATSAATVVTVNAIPSATITASGPTTFCQGGSVTLSAPATSSTGGNAINISGGAGNFVTVPHSNSIDIGAGTAYTIESWIRITDDVNNAIVDKGDYNFLFMTHPNNNTGLGLYNRNFGWIYSAGTVPVNQWVHVAVTYNNRNVVFYQNGIVQGTYTASANSVGDNGPMNIGRQSPLSCACNVFDGSMDELRLWNVAKTQAEIQASMNATVPTNSAGLVAYYKFDEGTGSAVADATANGNNGTVQNTASWMVPSTSPLGGTSGPTISYVWSPGGATTNSINVTTSGSYTLTANSSNGCSATSTATVVTVNPLPTATITAGGPTTFCQGGSVTLTASAGTSYLWSNGATTQAITVTAGGNYNVRVTNVSGCSATSANTSVTVNPLPTATITAGGPTTFCQGGSVTLTASAGTSYLWSNGATTQAITVTAGGNYNVRVTNANGCSATSANTTVTVNPLPTATITAGGATTFCQGGSVTLTASSGSSYSWSTGATTASINVSTSGNYTVTVTNANGCSTTSAVRTVTVNPLPVLTVTATPTSVSRGFNTQLNVTGTNLGTFAWTPTANLSSTTIANPVARVMNTTTYSVLVTSSAGCTATGNVTVTALDDLNITATNVFTPNGDGINDKFVIKNLDAYPNNKLQVMDRTGKIVYEKLNYANDWDGRVNGRLLTKDTYFYILIVNGQVLKKGSITLIRE